MFEGASGLLEPLEQWTEYSSLKTTHHASNNDMFEGASGLLEPLEQWTEYSSLKTTHHASNNNMSYQ